MPDAASPTLNAFKFHIAWAGATLGFSEASGLGAKSIMHSPALSTQQQPILTLSRGLFHGMTGFKSWLEIASTSAHDLTIHLHDDQQHIVASWLAKEAILIKQIAATNSDDHVVAIESLQLQYACLMLV